ncbi:hypothetical protein CROQUDRAFT_106261 [Cronartium quercuum f. sp. fusiforme G11]|uniref:SigF-like NTF2-like domain-containing protein n=1 Tax=Cronartium quercuum f. sp. fusiforme G11 TaxID=708437 RepID=A0A9P6TEH7_9BASI|nr:hypothetical protein CROQUDRAFT_106261 [Cronartium quercuum f. sp. fusiforme G11]
MDNPVVEIRDVVRSVTEPLKASTLAANVEKYFTHDATLQHPMVVVSKSPNSREAVKGMYKLLRLQTINQNIEFHAVMFNEDKTQVTIDLTEHMNSRFVYKSKHIALRMLVRLELVQGLDKRWRISRSDLMTFYLFIYLA